MDLARRMTLRERYLNNSVNGCILEVVFSFIKYGRLSGGLVYFWHDRSNSYLLKKADSIQVWSLLVTFLKQEKPTKNYSFSSYQMKAGTIKLKKKTTLGRDVIKQSLCIVIHVRNRSLKYRNQYSPFILKHFFWNVHLGKCIKTCAASWLFLVFSTEVLRISYKWQKSLKNMDKLFLY